MNTFWELRNGQWIPHYVPSEPEDEENEEA